MNKPKFTPTEHMKDATRALTLAMAALETVRPVVGARFQLPPGQDIRLGNDLPVVRRIRRSLNPGTKSHASGDLQRSGISQIDVTKAIEIQSSSVGAVARPGRPN